MSSTHVEATRLRSLFGRCFTMAPISKAKRKQQQAAADAFDSHFAGEYGAERWQKLRACLAQPTEYAALINNYAPSAEVDQALLAEASSGSYALFRLPQAPEPTPSLIPTRVLCLTRTNTAPGERPFPPPRPAASPDASRRLHTHWNLDAASVVAAQCLDVQPGHAVLDLCAAPGGKSITLAQRLWPDMYADKPSATSSPRSMLHSNEVDPARNRRLASNLQSYLPPQLMDQGCVEVLRIDGTSPRAVHLFPLGEEGYDRVLLDAPCSSERHILHAYLKSQQSGTLAPEMLAWKPTMTRSLAKTQLALLRTAWSALKPGGRLIYATCSLSQVENDQVVRSFLDTVDSENQPRILRSESLHKFCDATEYGYLALPDHKAPGAADPSPWGPLFFCMLRK